MIDPRIDMMMRIDEEIRIAAKYQPMLNEIEQELREEENDTTNSRHQKEWR